ncbi:MAG: hypothetical protein E7330_06350 [Clostridiales bacterium]|nr:hypothetical protein [Clostridiales bacterium]
MNADDVFFAATEGDKARLIELLQTGEVDISEPIDCGVAGGVHVTAPLLYSILNIMSRKAFLDRIPLRRACSLF